MKKSLVIVLTFLAFISIKCKQDSNVSSVTSYPESIMVSPATYNNFFSDVLTTVKGLNETDKTLLNKYLITEQDRIENAKAKINARVPGDGGTQVCTCLPGQTKCSADGAFSSCCICCANGQSAVCGVTLGFASCYCNDPRNRLAAGESTGSGDPSGSSFVKLYPQEIIKWINFASQNQVNISNLKNSLDIAIASKN